SILRQTEARWECILVDDGSTDATPEIARAWAAREPRVQVVRTPHRGLVAALAAGLGECRATIVARMDADDVMHRERLAAQLDALARDASLDAVGCHVRLFPRDRLTPGLRGYERWLNAIDTPDRVRAEAFVECPVAHPTLAVRTEVLAALGYRATGWPEDYDLILRMLASGRAVGVLPRRLLAWRDSPTRLSRTEPRYAVGRFVACKAAFLASGFLARDPTYLLCGYGGTGRRLRRALLVHGKRPSHVIDVHPRRLGETIDGAPVIPPDDLRRLRGRPIVASVAGEVGRQAVRSALTGLGFRELRDFVC